MNARIYQFVISPVNLIVGKFITFNFFYYYYFFIGTYSRFFLLNKRTSCTSINNTAGIQMYCLKRVIQGVSKLTSPSTSIMCSVIFHISKSINT